MRTDEDLLESAESLDRPITIVRFYRWVRPTASLGRNQREETALDAAFCGLHGIPIVRRPTGGRAVLHADEVTYAVISNDTEAFPAGNLSETYRRIGEALRAGLAYLGIDAEMARVRRKAGSPVEAEALRHPCFESTARHELAVGQRKIAGSAQRRKRRAFLQHGSIPLSIDFALMAAALGTTEQRLRLAVISLSEAARRRISWDEAAAALRRGFLAQRQRLLSRIPADVL